MSVECFRHRRFREASLRLITLLSSIASDYAADGMKLTVRRLYYQCVARDWIENNEREYLRLSDFSWYRRRCDCWVGRTGGRVTVNSRRVRAMPSHRSQKILICFVESLITQTLIVHVIRTNKAYK